MRWLVILVLFLACERQGQPSLWRAPKVGDHGTGLQHFTATIEGPDGTSHTIENRMETASETLAIDGDHKTKTRMTIVSDKRLFDGAVQPGLSGTFEMTEKPDGSLDVVRVGGTISAAERDFFTGSHHHTRAAGAAARRFIMRSFKVGEVLELTADEIAGLGFGMSSITLTVTDVKPHALTFRMKTIGAISDIGRLEAEGTLRMMEGPRRELEQDGEIFRDGKRIGTLHIVQRSSAK